jgi:16S rRNA (cytosine967-C5)-methyltransferase
MPRINSRQVALRALHQWSAGEQFADALLGAGLAQSSLSPSDRGFAMDLFYGVIRNLTLLDFWVGRLRSAHLDAATRDLLRLGVYQMLILQIAEHAAVFETVALAPAKARPLVNGVLRNAQRRKTELLAAANAAPLTVRRSHPEFLIERWTKNFGPEHTEALCAWNNSPAPVYARINELKISPDTFLSRYPEARCVQDNERFVELTALPGEALSGGHCYIQDPSTAVACLLLDPKSGERVLDACAAPGGKTGMIADLMANAGTIIACDRDSARLGVLKENVERLGVEIVQARQHDWTSGQLPNENQSFDRILIDAPCSNTGVVRRRVDVRWRLRPSDFSQMPLIQSSIVRTALPSLKPGGTLVYSTCSIEPEENEQVVAQIVREFPFLELEAEKSVRPFRDQLDGAYAAKLVRRR